MAPDGHRIRSQCPVSFMREQIARLAALSADSDRVTILVLPFASGAHAGAGSGPVTIFGFGRPDADCPGHP